MIPLGMSQTGIQTGILNGNPLGIRSDAPIWGAHCGLALRDMFDAFEPLPLKYSAWRLGMEPLFGLGLDLETDWFHESCLDLRERVPPRDVDEAQETEDGDDGSSVHSSTSLPPALLPGDTYETLICGSCVRKITTVKRYAGTKGVRMVIPDEAGNFNILGEDWEEQVDVEETQGAGTKRRASGSGDEQAHKRARAESSSNAKPANPCTAPPLNPLAQTVLADPTAHGDVFLSPGWRDRWCRCETCYPSILKHPFLIQDEETYEPPQDPDAGLSLEELGMRALATLPHERALDSIRAYNAMRDDLMLYLRPFADSGREVREEDITAFFQRRQGGV
ncbi:unnamed protein product [Rhizoctonia solani]|uniref:Uncharacterized protein n=1 Tax=Rhizoctonia solani TaxID=456999 RepID=A0A8H3EEA5_9AGAM|nr:unnamed protein product [Rhizoctonia solani]